jgi:hypothetical protein
MAASSMSDERGANMAAELSLDDVLRDAGFHVTDEGRAHWRRRLATPIPADALAEGQRLLDQADGRAA